jgi:MFS family permease
MLIAFRFLSGTAVVAVVLNPSIVGGLYPAEHRGCAMAITGFGPLIGPVIGPIIGSYLGQSAGWRWTFWLVAILCGFGEILFLIFFRETYKVRILQDKAKEIRNQTGDSSVRSKYEPEHTGKMLKGAFNRPL